MGASLQLNGVLEPVLNDDFTLAQLRVVDVTHNGS